MSDDVHHLAAAYALDGLEPDERDRFEAHLPGCEHCREDVRQFRDTAAELAGAVATPPPAALRDRVLAEVAATRQLRPVVRPLPSQWVRRPLAALVAAAAVVLVVLGGGLAYRDVAAERDRAQELAAVLAAPDARTAPLEGVQGATLRVVWSPSRSSAVVVGAGLPDPGPGRVYELWALAPDGAHPAGLFRPDDEGEVRHRLEVPVDPGQGWGVTVEPAGGSPQPTGEILFQGAA